MKTKEIIELDSAAIDRGYKTCKSSRKFFGEQSFAFNNLPNDQRRGIDALSFHSMRCIDMLDLDSPSRLPLDVWSEVRDEVSDAFLDKCASVDLAALAHTCRQFEVRKQFLFDQLEAADTFYRFRGFDTWDELKAFCSRMGGSAMASSAPVLGIIKPDYEVPAIKLGQAIMLTELACRFASDLKRDKVFLAKEDIEECEIVLNRVKVGQADKSLSHLIRLYCSRAESLFREGGHFLNHLDFDGKRSIKSLMTLYWNKLLKIRVEPEVVMNEEGVLSKRELLYHKSRHLMGLESQLPIFPEDDHDHH